MTAASPLECAPGPGLNEASRTASDSGAEAVGSGNTRLCVSSETPTAGVDTWRLGFKVARRPPVERGSFPGYAAQWHPGTSLLTLEGHPLASGLCSGELLGDVFEDVHELVEDVCGRSEPTGVLRLDSTAQCSFADDVAGLAVLRGVAAVIANVPRLKPEVIGKPPETVYLLSKAGRGAKLARVYDPSFRGVTERGQAVRMEAQDRRLELDYGLNARTPRERFHRRFVPLWRAGQNVTVAGVPVIARRLAEKLDAGELTLRQAEALGGHVLLEVVGRGSAFSRSTAYRRRAMLLEHGLALADDSMYEPVEVDLSQVFESALDSPGWL